MIYQKIKSSDDDHWLKTMPEPNPNLLVYVYNYESNRFRPYKLETVDLDEDFPKEALLEVNSFY